MFVNELEMTGNLKLAKVWPLYVLCHTCICGWCGVFFSYRDDVEWSEELQQEAAAKVAKNSQTVLDDEAQCM